MHISYYVSGLQTPYDSMRFEKALSRQNGVRRAYVNYAANRADVSYRAARTDPDCFRAVALRCGLQIRQAPEAPADVKQNTPPRLLFCGENAKMPLRFCDVLCRPGIDAKTLLFYAASAMRHSKVSPQRAFCSLAKKNHVRFKKPKKAEITVHQGVRATIAGAQIAVGTSAWMTRCGIPLRGGVTQGQGQYAVYVAKDKRLLGCFLLEGKPDLKKKQTAV